LEGKLKACVSISRLELDVGDALLLSLDVPIRLNRDVFLRGVLVLRHRGNELLHGENLGVKKNQKTPPAPSPLYLLIFPTPIRDRQEAPATARGDATRIATLLAVVDAAAVGL
jgi:hypothetical protein